MPNTAKVSAGEVCSIDIAKKYGFYDPENYYTIEYSDTRTYGPLDTADRTAKVCKQTSDGSVAYPACQIVHGTPYEPDKIDPNKCVISECPPGFQKEQERCIKPSDKQQISIPIGKKTHCDEKIPDWYLIPNYHLGNKYNFISDGSNTTCMKPCPVDKVPGYIEDPVDGSSAGVLTNTELDQCYNKDEYMGGKYYRTGNFCPISWVYRLGQTKEDIMTDMTAPITKLENNNGANMYLDKAKEIANSQVDEIYTESKKLLENVEMPSGVMLSACTKLHTQERVKKAYGICKNIYDTPNAINTILKDPTQQKVLRQACNALFCNEKDDLVSTISPGTEALCFNGTGNVSNKELLNNDRTIESDQSTEILTGPEPNIQNQNEKDVERGFSSAKWATYTGIFIVIILPILIIGGYILYRVLRWIWIHIINPYLWCSIKGLLKFITLNGPESARNTFHICRLQKQK